MHLEDGPVEMPEKGQLVATLGIREEGGYGSSDQPVAIKVQDAVLFKRVDIRKVKSEFESLSRDVQSHLKKHDVKQKDVAEAIKWARKRRT